MIQDTQKLVEGVLADCQTEKLVVIPIGLPGSGKSTFVNLFRDSVEGHVEIHSTDNFFIEEGQYKFDPTKLGRYHRQNLENFKNSLKKNVPVIIVDNTNLRGRDRNKYASLAEDSGYEVRMVVIGEFTDAAAKIYANRNTHGVPLDTIMRMAAKAFLPEGISKVGD